MANTDLTDPGNTIMQHAKRSRHDVCDDDDDSGCNLEIKSLLMSLSNKIDSLNDVMSDNNARLSTKIDNLEATLSTKIDDTKAEMETRIQAVSNDFDQRLKDSMMVTKKMCDESTSNAMNVVKDSVDKLRAYHESRLDKLERFSLEKDLLISGIPLENNDDPYNIVWDICGSLNCNLRQNDFVSVFRLRSNKASSKNNRTVPIVARIQDDWVKQELLSAYFKKKNLNLTDIGFKTASRIFINERLTLANREIFNRASEAKKQNLICAS